MIGIIVPGNKKYMPYIQNYINILDANNIQYKVLSWNKTGMQEENISFSYDFVVKDKDRKRMFMGYLGFVCGCRKYIKKNRIDQLIILTAAPAFFLGMPFLNRFKQKYLIDIRDDSPLIRKFPALFKKICAGASSVVVSSNQFSPWTGRETILCHNADMNLLQRYKETESAMQTQEPVRIVFAGMMIEGACNIEVLGHFIGDERFQHIFIGRENSGTELIRGYAQRYSMTNVAFQGAYKKEEIIDIYGKNADLINIFRAKTIVNRNALPNKLYEAVLAGRPVVVYEHNLAIVDYVKKYNLGIVIPEQTDKALNDFIYEAITAFDYKKYRDGRIRFLNEVEQDMEKFESTILGFANV